MITIFTIEKTAEATLIKHGLDQKGWTFEWNNSKRSFGLCNYQKKKIFVSLWAFNNTVIDQRDKFVDTIKHEVAHALAGSINKHNNVWKWWAIKVGAKPQRGSHVNQEDALKDVKYVIKYGQEIIKTYYRKPSQKIFDNIKRMHLPSVPGSFGKLSIEKL